MTPRAAAGRAVSLAAALGVILMALWLANHFGKVRKNAPQP